MSLLDKISTHVSLHHEWRNIRGIVGHHVRVALSLDAIVKGVMIVMREILVKITSNHITLWISISLLLREWRDLLERACRMSHKHL